MGGREEYLSLIDGGAAEGRDRSVGAGSDRATPKGADKRPCLWFSSQVRPRQNEFIARPDAALPPSFPLFAQGDNGGGNGSNAANTSVVSPGDKRSSFLSCANDCASNTAVRNCR